MHELTAVQRLQQGKEAVQDRDTQRAIELLQPLVEQEPGNAEAWLWLSGAQSSPAAMAECLQRVLEIEPANQDALDTMAWLEAKHGRDAISPPNIPAMATSRPRPEAARATEVLDDQHTPEPASIPVARSASATEAQVMPERNRQSQAPKRLPASQPRAAAPSKQTNSRIYPSSPYARPIDRRQLLDYGLRVGGVGVLIGLVRLAGQLRPGTLLLIRGSDGAIAPAGAVGIALATALLHALALVAVWQVLGRSVAAARTDRPGDVTDSLGRLATVFWPGYSVVLALLLVTLSLSAGERRWISVVTLVWIILLVSIVLAGRRLATLCDAFGVRDDRRGTLLRIALPAIFVGIVGLGIAGLVTRRLLGGI